MLLNELKADFIETVVDASGVPSELKPAFEIGFIQGAMSVIAQFKSNPKKKGIFSLLGYLDAEYQAWSESHIDEYHCGLISQKNMSAIKKLVEDFEAPKKRSNVGDCWYLPAEFGILEGKNVMAFTQSGIFWGKLQADRGPDTQLRWSIVSENRSIGEVHDLELVLALEDFIEITGLQKFLK